MKKSLVKQILLLSIGLLMYCNSSSQEVNMNRWIDIIYSDGWRERGYPDNKESIQFMGDSANTKIKIVSGWRETTKTIGADWEWLDNDYYLVTDTIRIYGNVKGIDVGNNEFKRVLDFDNNTELTEIYISGSAKWINISNCIKLRGLYCGGCYLTSIDLSQLTELTYLSIGGNLSLSYLDLSNQKKLKYLYCENSGLISLDLRGLPDLLDVFCYDTKISTAGYDSIFCALPERSGIGDDYGWFVLYSESFPSSYNIVIATNSQNAISKGWYVLNRNFEIMTPTTGTFDCSTIGIEDIDVDIVEAKVYPNPAIDYLSIETKEVVQRLEVYDALGRKVVSKIPNQNNFSIDISNLEQGIYILKLQTKEGIGSYKIVKN
ncbi:MAG: T9SS type A sorting domain-containing protein [Bacteroidales bacterium]